MKTALIIAAIIIASTIIGCKEEYRYEYHKSDYVIVFDKKTGTIYLPTRGTKWTIDGVRTHADGHNAHKKGCDTEIGLLLGGAIH